MLFTSQSSSIEFSCRNFENGIFVLFQRSRCNGNCGNGHEGEKYCILDSHYVESFLEKGVLTSSCIYV